MRPHTLAALAGAVMLAAEYGGGASGRGGMGGYRLSPEERAKRQAAKLARAETMLAKAEAKRARRRSRNAQLEVLAGSPAREDRAE